MIISNSNLKPGRPQEYVSQPRDIFWQGQEFAQYIAGPVTIDGTKSSNPQNTVAGSSMYQCYIFSGTPMGKVTATGKFANSFLGPLSATYTGNTTFLNTDANTALEIVRRIGTNGNLTVCGNVSGTIATATFAYSAVNTSTGNITVTADATQTFPSGSLIGDTDGSQVPVTLLADNPDTCKVGDDFGVRYDVFNSRLWAGGGVVNEAYIWAGGSWPTDTVVQNYIISSIRTNVPDAKFRFQLMNA